MPELTQIKDIVNVLQTSKVVAVVGFHPDTTRPAHYVPEYLHRRGYKIIPVNPALAGRHLSFFGHKAISTLAEITESVDVVEVFRRSDKVMDHLEDILAMNPRPKTVWLQQGIRNDEFAEKLVQQGIQVIQDRCMLADHRQYL